MESKILTHTKTQIAKQVGTMTKTFVKTLTKTAPQTYIETQNETERKKKTQIFRLFDNKNRLKFLYIDKVTHWINSNGITDILLSE